MTSWVRTNRQLLFKVLGSLLALGSLFFLFKQQSWGEIVDAVQQVTWDRFAIAVGLLFLSRFFTIARWYVLLRSADVEISFWQATSITFTGLFASNFLPTTVGGDVVRIGGAIQSGYDRAISTASVIVDRLVGMLGMAMVLPIGLLSFGQWYAAHPAFLTSGFPLLGWREKIVLGFSKPIFRTLKIE